MNVNVESILLSGTGEALSQPGLQSPAISIPCLTALHPAEDHTPHWFAVFTASRHEKRVAEHCAQRSIEAFLPTYEVLHSWRNRQKVTVTLPLFPTYIFVHISPRERVRVLDVPGVWAIVGTRQAPAPLPDSDIEALRSGLCRRKVEPYPYLMVGEKVRIKTGAMEGLEGFLVRIKSNFRVVLTLESIRQSVAVEVDAGDVEPVSKAPIHRSSERPLAAYPQVHPGQS